MTLCFFVGRYTALLHERKYSSPFPHIYDYEYDYDDECVLAVLCSLFLLLLLLLLSCGYCCRIAVVVVVGHCGVFTFGSIYKMFSTFPFLVQSKA